MKFTTEYCLLLKTFYKIASRINSSVIFTQYFAQNDLLYKHMSEICCIFYILAYADFSNGLLRK